MPPTLRHWRTSLFVLTLATGIGMASWIARTPAIRDSLAVSSAGMGLVLFGLSAGSMTGVLLSSGMVRRAGGRATLLVSAVLMVAGLAVVAGAATGALAPGVFCGLALFGAGVGLGEIALNIEGAAVEHHLSRPVLPLLHGGFSLGTVVGAGLGMALTAWRFPVVWHLSAATAVVAAASVWAIRGIPAGTGRATGDPGEVKRSGWRAQLRVWRDGRLVLIGVIVLAMAFAEGSANDWLPLLMVDGHGTSATGGSLTYLLFAAAMTCGRLAGNAPLARYGRTVVIRAGALVAAAGLALVIFSSSALLAGAAVVLWGLGAALGFPVSVSAAGDDETDAAARVGAVATAGYAAFLVGPPLLGFLAEHVGLRAAMAVVLLLLVIASLFAGAMRPRHTPSAVR
ncbi:MFS transporter [Streptomyces tubbatahanensis]|uniref:MFS transporter n=1 Tax=Streptomyces tubbatahanensis TaxID=2923272 RepID=A0ABY3XMC4_9ACTN|nr:MFS transporter [Streptomyces tubbatahanensis]UNS95566.1 MFS transporter [Streptomyces tubbatahanensis]